MNSLSLLDIPAPSVDEIEPLDVRHVHIDDGSPHPSRANGVHHVAHKLAREQIHAGDIAKLVFLRTPRRKPDDGVVDIPSMVIPLVGRTVMGRCVQLAPQMLDALLACVGPRTVFHIHGARHPLLWALTRQLRQRNIPYGITVHGRYSHVFDRDLQIMRRRSLLYLKAVERPVLEGARFVQAITELERRMISEIAPRASVWLIPNAAYSSAFDGALASVPRQKPSPHFPVFGFCGRYAIEHKGLDLLIDGFAQYRGGGGTGTLKLTGTGAERSRLAARVQELGLGEVADVAGPRFGAEKIAEFQSWDFFVQPSRFDTLPTGVLEAALWRLPLLVTTETGLLEAVQARGAGVPIRQLSAAAVADAMHQAARLSPADWARMSASANLLARGIGDWTAIAAQLRLLYGGV